MNPWLEHRLAKDGERLTLEAEKANRQLAPELARDLYRQAGAAFESVALSVPQAHANARGDLGAAAVTCFARAGDYGRAVDLARRLLAQPALLDPAGIQELEDSLHAYQALMPLPGNAPAVLPPVRASSRRRFGHWDAA